MGRQKEVTFYLSPKSERGNVKISKEKFSRVIENLFSNALKFSRNGDTVTLSVKTSENNVIISVADTGIGIPSELHDKIFDQYTKAGRQGTAGEKTIGLGMSIAKKLVEQHHGTLWFESEPEKGTTFYIKLPIA